MNNEIITKPEYSTPPPQPVGQSPTTSKELSLWEVVKKSFTVFVDNLGISLALALLFLVLNIAPLILDAIGIPLYASILVWVMSTVAFISVWYFADRTYIANTRSTHLTKDTLGTFFFKIINWGVSYILFYVIALSFFLVTYLPFVLGVQLGAWTGLTENTATAFVILTLLGSLVFTMPLQMRYLFAPYVVIEDNVNVITAFRKSSTITSRKRLKLTLLTYILIPIVMLSGILALGIGVIVTLMIAAYIIPVVAYRTLRAQELNESLEAPGVALNTK